MFQDLPISVRVRLAGLWTTLMLIYIYADVFSLYRPGYLAEIGAGRMGPLEVSQGTLLFAAGLMTLPALMVAASLMLPTALSRWGNVGLGILYTLVNISNLVGESWGYYWMMGVVEILITLGILAVAWSWPRVE